MATLKNIYKPRYKIAYQAKSKIWPYKNSRMRRFFNIRGRKLVRGGLFRKYVLVFNRMKWTIARRFIKPYRRKRKGMKRTYRSAFYTKQKLRHFYGKVKENAFRKIFRTHLIAVSHRNRSFFSALERRLDMFFFRMRLLPTIYACHQFVHHNGLLRNRYCLEKSPNALVNVTDIISIPKKYWAPMAKYVKYRVFFRIYGRSLLKRRQHYLLKRKLWWAARRSRPEVYDFWFWKVQQLRLVRLLNIVQKRFLKFFGAVVGLLSRTLLSKKNKSSLLLSKLQSFYHRLYSLYQLFFQYLLSLTAELNSERKIELYKKLIWKTKKWRWRRKNSAVRLAVKSSLFFEGRQYKYQYKLLNLLVRLKLEELTLYSIIASQVMSLQKSEIFFSSIREKKELVLTQYLISKDKLLHYFSMLMRQEKRKQRHRLFFRFDQKTGQKIARGNILTFFLINRKYKKERRLSLPRLKPIHWYVPSYIYFDAPTLRGVLLYTPQANEIVYSFRCSLSQIYSFYKSLGL